MVEVWGWKSGSGDCISPSIKYEVYILMNIVLILKV